MIVLSIDSGLEKTGYAIFDKNKVHRDGHKFIKSGLIITSAKRKLESRLGSIYDSLREIISKNKPRIVVIEQLFFFKNQKTAIKVSQAQGIVLLLAAQFNLDVKFLTPLQVKQIVTGYGQADKKSIQKMLGLLLRLNRPLKQDDEADAIACGLAYCSLNEKMT